MNSMKQTVDFINGLARSSESLNEAMNDFKKASKMGKKLPKDIKEQILSQVSENTENKEMVMSILSKLL